MEEKNNILTKYIHYEIENKSLQTENKALKNFNTNLLSQIEKLKSENNEKKIKEKEEENNDSTNYMTNLNQINNLSYILNNNKSTFNNNYRKRNTNHNNNLHIKNKKINSKTAFILDHKHLKVPQSNKNKNNINISKYKEYIPMKKKKQLNLK